MAEDDMSKFDPVPGGLDAVSGTPGDSPGSTQNDKQKKQLGATMSAIEGINTQVEQLAGMVKEVGWGDLKTHAPKLFPAIEELRSFAEDLQHRLKGQTK